LFRSGLGCGGGGIVQHADAGNQSAVTAWSWQPWGSNGNGIEQAATRFLEVDNEFHITGSASAAVHSGVIPGIIQTNPIQFFDFVSDLFDFRSKFLHHLPIQRGCSS